MAAKPETTRPAEHNEKAFNRRLHQAGWPAIVCRFVSQFTGYLHTRTLNEQERLQFRVWASDQESIEQVDGDGDGDIYRVNI